MRKPPRWIERELFSLYTRYMREEIRKVTLEITEEQMRGEDTHKWSRPRVHQTYSERLSEYELV